MPIRIPGPRSPSWVFAESAAAAVLSLVSMLVIGRVIGPQETGIGTVAIAAFLMTDVIGAVLFADALVQSPKLERRHVDSAASFAVLLGATLGLGLALAAPVIAAGAGAPALVWLIVALAPLVPISAYAGTMSGLLLREHRFRLLALRLLLGQPLALLAGLLLAVGGFGAWAMVGAQVVGTAATFLLMAQATRRGFRPKLDFAALRALWPVALPQMAGAAVHLGRYRIFLLALGFIVPQPVLAVSHFAFRLLDAALSVVGRSIGRLAMPRLCALQQDRAALAVAYGELAQLQALLGLPICLGIALTAPDLVQVLLGPAWAGTAAATQVAALAAMATLLHGDPGSLFVATGKARRNLGLALAALILPLAALLLFRPDTPQEVAIVWSAQSLMLPPVIAWLVLAELGRPVWWLARQVAPAILAAAVMAAAVLLLQRGLAMPPAVRLLASAGLGAVVYGATAWLALGCRLPSGLRTGPTGPPLIPQPGRA